MSELNPLSQNSPGTPPARARTAIFRALLLRPTSRKAGSVSGMPVAAVMDGCLVANCLVEPAQSVNGRRTGEATLGLRPRMLAEPVGALYVGSARSFGCAGVA